MSSKTGSWDATESKSVVELYDGGKGMSVAELAENMGRSKRSIQGKLTAAKVYVPPVKVATVKKDDGPTKGEIITAIKATGRFVDWKGANGATKGFLTEVLALASA